MFFVDATCREVNKVLLSVTEPFLELLLSSSKAVYVSVMTVMSRSNRNFDISPPPPGKPRAFDSFLCPGSGEFDLCLGGVGKLNRKCRVSNDFFFWGGAGAPKSLTAINACLDEMEEFKGRDIAISQVTSFFHFSN